jgi:hypothetical protein
VRTLLTCLLIVLATRAASAQFKDTDSGQGPQLGSEVTTRIKLGVKVKAGGLLYRGIATVPVPADWPEQQVRVVDEDTTAAVKRLTYRDISGGGGQRQMVVEIPQLPAGQEAHALVTFEVTRRTLTPPPDTSIYQIPKRLDRSIMLNIGPSPFIESRHPKIIAAAKDAVGDASTAWQQVEALYDWTRNNIKYNSDDPQVKGAARALYDGDGYTDELCSVFIAMCRVHKIPARTVFVEGHCYAEFYLEDDKGQGHWFPCQLAGKRSFGGIDEVRPILQKGDNFKNPENSKEKLRYLREYFHANGRGGSPAVTFVSEPVEN